MISLYLRKKSATFLKSEMLTSLQTLIIKAQIIHNVFEH